MIEALKTLGHVEEEIPLYRNGKPSKFVGKLQSKLGNNPVSMGLLHYNWKRTIGVDKINQAIRYVNGTDLDGAIIVGSTFSKSAIEQANRINQIEEKKIVLLDNEELFTNFRID